MKSAGKMLVVAGALVVAVVLLAAMDAQGQQGSAAGAGGEKPSVPSTEPQRSNVGVGVAGLGGNAGTGLVARLRARGARLTGLGERSGLEGWLVELGGGDAYTLYVAKDGHAVAGLMYRPDGGLVTGSQLKAAGQEGTGVRGRGGDEIGSQGQSEVAHVAGSSQGSESGGGFSVVRPGGGVRGKTAPAGLFAKSVQVFGFTLGNRGKIVVVFADPGCRWSKEVVQELGRHATAGRFRLRVIPVGVLGARSATAAIRIVSSPDPALAWDGRDVAAAHRAGGMWVEENNGVFDRWGENAVPLIVWPDRKGGYVYRVGVIPDVPRWVEEVFGQ